MRKFLLVLRACHLCTELLIASTPGSSTLERPGLDNIKSQPWSDTTCPCTAYFRFVTLILLKMTRQSTRSGVTEARYIKPWLTRDIVSGWTKSFQTRWGMSQVSRRLEAAYINGAPSIPGYLLALLRELSQRPRAFYRNYRVEAGTKIDLTRFLYQFKKRVRKLILTFRT